jgi:hypothetical protein
MKYFFYILVFLFLISCNSNTIYKKPKGLIPKDSMVALLTDMYVASSAKNQKNKFLKRENNYVVLVYEKHKIDSARFDISNEYYTSKIEDYTDMLTKVKTNLDSLQNRFIEEKTTKDSLEIEEKRKDNPLFNEELEQQEMPKKLMEKNSKFLKKRELKDLKVVQN